ncbi:E3 ubiquitin-protein ligase Topors-like [Condylostylus longicornis]|uniref:E3 ubiquitin-protein ligase Topors-like n=1 Tax=Condylostylus longicornis TaxID=2530218 RepID=UPI00244DD38C|nr:E3 ubiquitin-protein ligase Topors-like [Condylostylus longicornis]XP_055374193.1 E3 ubiquitin-protein ligase Topors-like [Condylostylus longicornis]
MARSFAMECPVTPERVDQCPATPDFIRRPIKSPESTSSSDESTFHGRVANGSPPPNCAICLGKCKNKCFTDSCLHQFCFKCLLEWSKVKAECPLCKQCFKSIIHNVKSDDQFEEYWVQSPSNIFPDFSRPMRAHIQIPSRSTFNAAMQLQSNTLSNSIIQLRSNISTRFRRYVYDGELYASPLPDVTGRFRECSARFYRENPTQVHRLMPWLNRELICLLRDTNYSTSTLLEMIPHLLTIFNINSPDFRRRVSPFLGQHTAHFIHEFLNFARSPYDMIGYDREVRYAGNSNEGEVVINETSSSSDSDEVAEIAGDSPQLLTESLYNNRRQRNNPALGLTIETSNNQNSAVSTVHIIIADGDSNGSNNNNLDTSNIQNQNSQLTAINLSTNNNPGISNNETNNQMSSEIRILNESPIEITETNQSSRQISDDRVSLLSSTSSDACEFVLERKPPHLRTPEMVSLNSDSDSDVVFISEERRVEKTASNGPTPGTSGVSFSIAKQRKMRSSKMRNIRGIFIPSSDVDHSSDSDFKPPVETRRNRQKKIRTRQSEKTIKSEFIAGPSTSSGITSGGKPMSLLYSSSSSRDKRQKYKSSKPKIFGNRNGRSYKNIYQSSSSSDIDSSRHESDDDDHKSSSSVDHAVNTKKSVSSANSATSSSNTSSGTRSSSSSSCQSGKSKNFKNKTSVRGLGKLNRKGHALRKSTRSSSSSSSSSSALKMKVNGTRNKRSSSSSSTSTSISGSSSSTSNGTSDVSSSSNLSDKIHRGNISNKSTNSNAENIKRYKSIRKMLLRVEKNCKLQQKFKSDKQHSTRLKKDESITKSTESSKRGKKTKGKYESSKKKDHKCKRLKEKDRKRKLHSRINTKSTTEFSESDTEPLSKHVKLSKTEPVSCENVSGNSEIINTESGSTVQPTEQEESQSVEQDRDPTSVLLCFPNNVYLSINLSTTEQIQSEQTLLPSTNISAQQNSLISEE